MGGVRGLVSPCLAPVPPGPAGQQPGSDALGRRVWPTTGKCPSPTISTREAHSVWLSEGMNRTGFPAPKVSGPLCRPRPLPRDLAQVSASCR